MILEAVVVGAVVGTVLAFVRARREKAEEPENGDESLDVLSNPVGSPKRRDLRVNPVPGSLEPSPKEEVFYTNMVGTGLEPPEFAGMTNDGLGIGDVLLYADTEFWLAGGIELKSGRSGLRVFHCPGSSRGEWIIQQGRGTKALVLADSFEDFPAGRVPSEYPVKGLPLKLKDRGEVELRCEGEFPGGTPEKAEFTLLSGTGGKTLLVVSFQGGGDYRGAQRIVLLGDPLEEGLFELLGG